MEIESKTQAAKLDEIPGQITAVFKTELPEEYKVEELPITLETKSKSEVLSEVVTQLLENDSKSSNNQFCFRINGKLLRSNLKSHIKKYNLSPETTIEIFYSFAPVLPSLAESNSEEDWISSIVADKSLATLYTGFFVSTFGGSLSIYNGDNNRKFTRKITDEVILCSAFIDW